MIKKLIILTILLFASFCIQLFQLDIRLTYGQSIGYSSIPLTVIQSQPDMTMLHNLPVDRSYIQHKQSDRYKREDVKLLKEKIRQLDDPYPFVKIDRYFYNHYFDHSA